MLDPLSLAAATVVAKWFVEEVGKSVGDAAVAGTQKSLRRRIVEAHRRRGSVNRPRPPPS